MITDKRLQWLSGPDYSGTEPGEIAAALLVARARIAQLEADLKDNQECLSETCEALAVEHTHVEKLDGALRKSVETIQVWHNMGMSGKQASEMWDIYWRNAPEMKQIREALTASETPAEPPTWEDLRGAAPDATGSLNSEAFVRQLRNEWDKETASKSCNCGWPRTTDGEHGDNCPAKTSAETEAKVLMTCPTCHKAYTDKDAATDMSSQMGHIAREHFQSNRGEKP